MSSSSLLSPPPSTIAAHRRLLHRRHLPISSLLQPSPPPATPKVFVSLPLDAVSARGQIERRKTISASMVALSAAGVEGVSVEVWWGVVEREAPGVYDWGRLVELIGMAGRSGLKVRAVVGFHQRGVGPGDPCWLPLPCWVLEEMDDHPELAYTDRFGRRNREYISLGCDMVPILKGRSPIQAYSDFMRSFRDTFREALGVIITEIQVGMGPSGELRYPSCPSGKLLRGSTIPKLGEFQCYDKYMIASLNAAAQKIGMREWGRSGPLGAGSLSDNPEETNFFRRNGYWNTAYGRFFLEWYSGMLLLHGERLCKEADTIFLDTGVRISAKLAGMYSHYCSDSHPSELTAGYYNTCTRDGYLPIAHVFGRHKIALCCTCFDLRDEEEKEMNPKSSPEGFLRQLLHVARICNLPLTGENSRNRLDDASLKQVVKSSKLYADGLNGSSLSFNFVRMNKSLFDPSNWVRFTRFVRQMSDVRTFQARLRNTRIGSCFSSAFSADDFGRPLAYL